MSQMLASGAKVLKYYRTVRTIQSYLDGLAQDRRRSGEGVGALLTEISESSIAIRAWIHVKQWM